MRRRTTAALSAILAVAFATTALAEVPDAPDKVRKRRISPDEVRITWRDRSDNELGFEILRREIADTEFDSRGFVGPGMTEFIDSAQRKPTYIYHVVAFNEDGDSDLSHLCYVNRNPPNKPSYFRVRLIALYVMRLSWSDRANGEGGFLIQRKDEFAKRFRKLARVPANTEVFDDDTLKPANTYTYRVKTLGKPAICWDNSRYTKERTETTKGGVRIVQVELRGRGRGTVTSDPPGISCGPKDDHCTHEFPLATNVVLTAKPNNASRFAGWTDYHRCEGSKENECVVYTNESYVVGAAFKKN